MPFGPPWIFRVAFLIKCTSCWRSPLHLADKAQPGANYVVWRYSSILLKHSSYSRGLEASMLLLYKLRLLPLMPAWTWHYCDVQLARCPPSFFSHINLDAARQILRFGMTDTQISPVGHSLNVSLMLYRSRWRSLWKCVCIETLILIGKSSTRRQPCSLKVYKHLMHTREHDNTTSSSLVLVLASPWKMTANLNPCISMRVCKW